MSPSKLRVNTQRLHRAYSSGDLGRRPKFATNVAVLLLTNVGLLSFFLGGVYFLLSGWDQTATLCVVGYVCCGLALAIPSMTFSKSLDDEKVACDDDEAKRDAYLKPKLADARSTAPAAAAAPALASLSYPQLQAECKRLGLPAKGKAGVLRERIAAHRAGGG